MAININPNQFLFNNLKTPANKVDAGSKALTESLEKTVPGLKIGPKQSAEDTAKNILGFVKNGLSQLASQGASSERLQQRLDAAKEGIEKGYKQAVDMLKGLGLYDDELKQDVDKGRELVDAGMLDLANNLDKLNQPQKLSANSMTLANSKSMTLEVLTREGDRVSVTFNEQQAGYVHGDRASSAFQQSWSMSVEGHLSQAEQEALSGLFDNVQSLSQTFFAGDIGSALEKAMNLGFDGKQLASLSLNLTQRTHMSVTSPYSAVKEQLPTPELESLKAPLASYVDSYMKALDKAGALANPVQTMQQMIEKMLPEEFQFRMPVWKSFHEGLNSLLGVNSNKA